MSQHEGDQDKDWGGKWELTGESLKYQGAETGYHPVDNWRLS